MNVQMIQPRDEAHWHEMRASVVTSTEVAALFDASPHCTIFELYHRKRDRLVVQAEPNERIRWGQRLQDSIAAGIAEDSGFKIRKMTEFALCEELMLGASFDFEIIDSGLLEVKNVDSLQFRDGWLVTEDDVEAPPHIEIQVQTQLMLSKKGFELIGALVGGNRVQILERRPDPRIQTAILERLDWFRSILRDGTPPVPDYARDAALLSRLHGFAEPGKLHDARGDQTFKELAEEYKALGDAAKHAEEERLALKMRMLERIGDAEKAIFDGGSVSAGIIKGGPVSYERSDYRGFRVNWKKAK